MNTEYLKLFTDTNIIVTGLKNLLEVEGIPSLLKDKFESARLGGYGEHSASVEIHVLNKDLEKAEKVLTIYKEKINS